MERETTSLTFYANVRLLRTDGKREVGKVHIVSPEDDPLETFLHFGLPNCSYSETVGAILQRNHLIGVQYVNGTILRLLFESAVCTLDFFMGGCRREIESYQWIGCPIEQPCRHSVMLLSKIHLISGDRRLNKASRHVAEIHEEMSFFKLTVLFFSLRIAIGRNEPLPVYSWFQLPTYVGVPSEPPPRVLMDFFLLNVVFNRCDVVREKIRGLWLGSRMVSHVNHLMLMRGRQPTEILRLGSCSPSYNQGSIDSGANC